MSKRSNDFKTRSEDKRVATLDSSIVSQYTGYFPPHKDTKIDVIDLPSTAEAINSFYENYVIARKPCKIKGVCFREILLEGLSPANINSTLPGDEILQVERKVDGGFGSGEKRLKMSFEEFMNKVVNDGNDLYLTTQYVEDDPDQEEESFSDEGNDSEEEEAPEGFADLSDAESLNFNDAHDDFEELNGSDEDDSIVAELCTGSLTTQEAEQRIKELYQPPMTNLVKRLPETPKFLASLIPQQINLWIGSASSTTTNDVFLNNFDATKPKLGLGRNVPGEGSSSGLHHDHADNIYIPINGHKRFTLFSPGDAAKMYTVGDLRKVFDSGVIDYVRNGAAPSWRMLRDDGAVIAEVAKQKLESHDTLSEDKKQELLRIIEADESDLQEIDAHTDPPSFSNIPPSVVHLDKIKDSPLKTEIEAAAIKKWPLFFDANRITVDLHPGEMLFLPTGWFHEVTSFGNAKKSIPEDKLHIAVNYWFIPPNGKSISNLYPHEDRYWPLDYDRTKIALSRARLET
ncbi:LAFE_0D12112g1_1 [Lachancea fermentati]|uniref:LAFE_0D12112g1_1 n=1 Tax=Lachancea fermentati TaxID=4955 RepID=A0A1G4MCJ5_LACFM|nr:LAFE_0D12112g1_1 [Lachancea fermentati]